MPTDPAYVLAFKEFSRANVDPVNWEAMASEFYGENDRASAILLGSMVEVTLEGAIKSLMRRDLKNKEQKEVFDGDAPLSTFSAKTKVGFALGIFGPEVNNDLYLIRTIRNEFAHSRRVMDFETPTLATVCSNLLVPDWPTRCIPIGIEARRIEGSIQFDMSSPKLRFQVACHTISVRLIEFNLDQSKRSELGWNSLP